MLLGAAEARCGRCIAHSAHAARMWPSRRRAACWRRQVARCGCWCFPEASLPLHRPSGWLQALLKRGAPRSGSLLLSLAASRLTWTLRKRQQLPGTAPDGPTRDASRPERSAPRCVALAPGPPRGNARTDNESQGSREPAEAAAGGGWQARGRASSRREGSFNPTRVFRRRREPGCQPAAAAPPRHPFTLQALLPSASSSRCIYRKRGAAACASTAAATQAAPPTVRRDRTAAAGRATPRVLAPGLRKCVRRCVSKAMTPRLVVLQH